MFIFTNGDRDMAFVFEENVEELFILDADGKGMPKVNRAKVREMAERSHNYIKLVEASGGNKHSAELDVNDAVVEMLTKIMLSELKDNATTFNSTFTEEKLAITFHESDKADAEQYKKIEQEHQAARDTAMSYNAISWLVAIAGVLLFAGFLFS